MPTPVLNCLNGGVAANGTCYCAPLFTGPSCGVPICLNNGTAMASKEQTGDDYSLKLSVESLCKWE